MNMENNSHQSSFFIFAIFASFILGVLLTIFILKPTSPKPIPTLPSQPTTGGTDLTKYSLEKQLQGDLDGDGQPETIKIFAETVSSTPGGGRSLPILTKIYSNVGQEVFSFNGNENPAKKRSGNELADAQILSNFFGDGRNALLVVNESTGYGSGSGLLVNFILHGNSGYQIVAGPAIVGGLDAYKFKDSSAPGKEIIVSHSLWQDSEAHYDPHQIQFEQHIWDGQQYVATKLGTTKKKYDSQTTIGQIIAAEPQVLTQPKTSANISVTLPVSVLQTGYGIGDGSYVFPYLKNLTVSVPKVYSDQLGAYGMANKIFIAPKNWTGSANVGADGSGGGSLYPQGGSTSIGPNLQYDVDPACVYCAYGAAAPYFSEARQWILANEPGSTVSDIPGITGSFINPKLYSFSLPNTADGLEVNGVAYFKTQPYFTSLTVTLPASQHDLASLILNHFITSNKLDP